MNQFSSAGFFPYIVDDSSGSGTSIDKIYKKKFLITS